jgi:hypothetical protein
VLNTYELEWKENVAASFLSEEFSVNSSFYFSCDTNLGAARRNIPLNEKRSSTVCKVSLYGTIQHFINSIIQ